MNKNISTDEMLEGDEKFIVNRKLLSRYGLDLTMFVSILLERLIDCIKSNNISENGEFTITDVEIALYGGLRYNIIPKIRDMGIKKRLFTTRKDIDTEEIYYKLNEEKIAKIILDEKGKIKLPPFKKNL